jgi:4-hydroxy-tetrahydrodipicolinate synthase
MLDPTTRSEAYAAIVPILEFIESGRYNAKIKAGMAMLGLDVGIPRAPLAAVDAATSAELAELLDAAGTWAPALADG